MERTRRAAVIHDLSGFGRCSLTVIMPTLSAMGIQCCPLPTAVLSTHTGGFEHIARTDLTEQLSGALRQWEELSLTFDGVYTGYMASAEQIALASAAVERLKKRNGIVVVDPVLGDHGRPYSSITPEMGRAMAVLCGRADVITPNLTETAALLGADFSDLPEDGGELAWALSEGGKRSVAVTGIRPGPGLVGAACYDRDSGEAWISAGPKVMGEYHGAGDLFASVLTGGLIRGDGLRASAERAVEFVRLCAERTLALAVPGREGMDFEPLLGWLCPRKER